MEKKEMNKKTFTSKKKKKEKIGKEIKATKGYR